ncbi:MAG: RidA family protein [Demequina sp.]|uniref:RidA family protein n=1 Tax=Demequina sp. TaxID=2050685 RepID=UPI003A8708AE
MTITHLNPASMQQSQAFSQGVIATGSRTVYVGGQNGTDARGAIEGDLVVQTQQALRNLLTVLAEAGASQEDVCRMTIYLQADQDVQEGYGATVEVWGTHAVPIVVVMVPMLGRPEALVEIDAIAVLD